MITAFTCSYLPFFRTFHLPYQNFAAPTAQGKYAGQPIHSGSIRESPVKLADIIGNNPQIRQILNFQEKSLQAFVRSVDKINFFVITDKVYYTQGQVQDRSWLLLRFSQSSLTSFFFSGVLGTRIQRISKWQNHAFEIRGIRTFVKFALMASVL